MKQRLFFCLAAVVSLFMFYEGFVPLTHADQGYVTNMLILSMREGPGRQYDVITTLRSNTPLDIIDTQGNFYKVRIDSGEEGWVESQYITSATPPDIQIGLLEEKIESLEKKIREILENQDPLKENIEALKKDNAALKKEYENALAALEKENGELKGSLENEKKRYETFYQESQNAVNLISENKSLKQRKDDLEKELLLCRQESEAIFKTGMLKFFLSGAAVLIAGWLIGRSVSGSKRSSGGYLR